MGNYRRWAWAAGAALLLAAVGPLVLGAERMNLPEMNVLGTIEGVRNGMVMVKTAGNEMWAVQVAPNAKVEVKGKVKPEFLAPGQYVEFIATVDMKSGKVEEKVSRLIVFTPSMRNQPGALPDQGFGLGGEKEKAGGKGDKEKAGGKGEKEKTGVKEGDKAAFSLPAFGGDGQGAGAGKGRKSRGGKVPGGAVKQSLDIRGQIGQMKNGSLSVHVPGFKTVTIEVAEDADVDVDLAGAHALIGAAVPGAAVQMRGHQRGAQPGLSFGIANDVEITLSRELAPAAAEQDASAKKKGNPKGVRPKRPAETDQPAAEEEEPKETKKPAKKPGKARPKEEPEEEKPAEKAKE